MKGFNNFVRQLTEFEIHMLSILYDSDECIWSFLNDLNLEVHKNVSNVDKDTIINFFEILYNEGLIELVQKNIKVDFKKIRIEPFMDFDTPYWFVLSKKGKQVFDKLV